MAWTNRIVKHGDADIKQIFFNPRNWRIHPKEQMEALALALDEVGIVRTLLINLRSPAQGWPATEQGETLIDGHARVVKAEQEGMKTWPADWVDLNPEEESIVLASLDSITKGAGTDQAKLAELTTSIAQKRPDLQNFLLYLVEINGKSNKRPPPDGAEGVEHGEGVIYHCPSCGFEWKE